MSPPSLDYIAPGPALGSYAEGFEPVARAFAAQLQKSEIGAGYTVYQHGRCVVDLWGGLADRDSGRAWERDTAIVLFSVTKGLASMAMHHLAQRGKLDFDAPVASYWPGFARGGKGAITVGTLMSHRAGLAALDTPMTLDDCVNPERSDFVREALEVQAPAWVPGTRQGYHGLTFGMYVRELFEQITGESMGAYLRRELWEPLGADVWLGAPDEIDGRVATLYPPTNGERARNYGLRLFGQPRSPEARIARSVVRPESLARRAFLNPATGPGGIGRYNDVDVRRAELAWASAVGTADGVARAYLPFAQQGAHDGRRYFDPDRIAILHERRSWSHRDAVIQKPLGWTLGFLKEQGTVFSPNRESFGHTGIGGALGWCDPVAGISLGYTLNRMDWRVRSPRSIALSRALYRCEPVRRAIEDARDRAA